MGLSVGIVGLPNVGKSTLFNAITNSSVDAQNYPFCTIEPNIGIVAIPDSRLEVLGKMSQSQKIVPAVIEFKDIAGLVKGASKGEGLGNKFLSHIREVNTIAHVVRCFKDENVVHVSGDINPKRDIEIIDLELILADYEFVEKLIEGQGRKAKTHIKEEEEKLLLLHKIKSELALNKSVRQMNLSADEQKLLKGYFFLTAKPVVYVANISEDMLGKTTPELEELKKIALSSGGEFMALCTKLEEELSTLSKEEKQEYLTGLGLKESGLDALSKACFKLLGLETFLTTGPKETRAWTIRVGDKAPKAAGVIHTDFEKGFIRANVISYSAFVENNGLKQAREKGLVRQEGKDYIMQDGDIVEFLFNV